MNDKTIELIEKAGMGLLVLAIAWVVIRVIIRLEKRALKKSRIDGAMHLFITRTTEIIFWILVIISIIPKSAPFVTALGAGGAAIALAIKDSLGNIAGGLLLIVNKPFAQGDTIEVNNTSGIVDSIDLMTTRLHTFDNKVVIIPNGVLNTSVIVNNSSETDRRVDCIFSIGYDADIQKAKEILLQVAKECPGAHASPEPVIGVSHHGESSIFLDLKVWCGTSDYFDVKYYLEEAVKLAFDKQNIVIPYPKLDVNITK